MHLTRLIPRLPRAVAGPAARRATTLSTAIPRASASQTPSSLSPTPAQQPAPTSVKEQLKQSLQRPVQHGTTEDGLRILIFGKPGSGKGTLSARLVQKYDLHFVSTGDVLRREIMNGTKVGKEAEAIVASGGLVSDELMLEIIQTELDKLHGESWILDGFPRTLRQAGLLDSALNEQGRPLNMIIHLAVPDAVIMKRISARWVHLPSGRVYNTQFKSSAPKVPGLDDETGEPLTRRPDDRPETFQRRLEAFYESTSPLLDYFADKHPESLHELAGATSDEIWPQLEALIDPYGIQRERLKPVDEEEVKHTREVADDLRDK
ncbi:Adenylate kinase 2 [Naganishia albida]|nr:Adenylate kinase 2 [Naganishia albida]